MMEQPTSVIELLGLIFVSSVLIIAGFARFMSADRQESVAAHQEAMREEKTTVGDKTTVGLFLAEVTRLRYRRGSFFGCRLEGFTLIGVSLPGLDLSRYTLRDCNFNGANLTNANLQDADLWRINLASANLEGANLAHVTLHDVNFADANLSKTRLMGIDFQLTELNLCNILDAQYDFLTKWPGSFDPDKYGAKSIDGLGPRSLGLCIRDSWIEDMTRSITRAYAIGSARHRAGELARPRSAVLQKLTFIMSEEHEEARGEWFYKWLSDFGGKSNSEQYAGMTVEDYYYYAACDIRYSINIVFQHQALSEILKHIVARRYIRLWVDFLELHEHKQQCNQVIRTPREEIPAFESPIEQLFWNEWQNQGGSFTLELVYQYQPPNTPYRLDFAHLPSKTAIELDGYEYHNSRAQFTHDRKRQRELERLGWRFIRFSGSEVIRSPADCFAEVARSISAATSNVTLEATQVVRPTKTARQVRTRNEISSKLRRMVEHWSLDVTTTGNETEREITLEGIYRLAADDIVYMKGLTNEHLSLEGVRMFHEVGAQWLKMLEEVEFTENSDTMIS